ncbi:MAG: hypothetical protein D6785_08870 [Planctomycetota bacterium]|nr:MAG: hypothetical protein D6785_08870 [Planctomycetota bacterium]
MGIEKRETTRYEFEGEVKIKILFTPSENLKEVEAKIGNVSAGGLFIKTDEPFEEGALADLAFKLPDKLPANTLGLIKWAKPNEGIGIEFFYATEEEKQAIIESLRRAYGQEKQKSAQD